MESNREARKRIDAEMDEMEKHRLTGDDMDNPPFINSLRASGVYMGGHPSLASALLLSNLLT